MIEHGIVGRLDPDLPPPFREALVGPGIVLAPPKTSPERAILRCRGVGGLAEHAVMLAGDFRKAVPKRPAKILVRLEDISLEIELYDRLRLGNGIEDIFRIGRQAKHSTLPVRRHAVGAELRLGEANDCPRRESPLAEEAGQLYSRSQ